MEGLIRREPRLAAGETFDLVIVGAGVYGAAAALAASRAGHRVLLLEREDFGCATSWNSLRTLHGGLRYLQNLDIRRFRESVEARSWYFDELPDLVEPLPCLMPLYGKGLRRRATLGPALMLNEQLRRRWSSSAERAALPEGGLVSTDGVIERYPGVRRDGLQGGALWYDGWLAKPQRVLIEMLRRAAALGGRALNYFEVTGWDATDGRVAAVRARDTFEFHEYAFRTRAVLNCAGPWAPALAAVDDAALARSFHPSLAFNLLLDHPLDSSVSVAIEPPGGGRTYFLHPLGEQTLAGTYHAPLTEGQAAPMEEQVEECLAELRAAAPGFDVTSAHVRRVMSGVLPARRPGTAELSRRTLYHHAADAGGPAGLHSLVGIKYTTAPLVAARAVAEALGGAPVTTGPSNPPAVREVPEWAAFTAWSDRDPEAAGALIDSIVEQECVLQPDDLLLRRTDWGLDPVKRGRVERRIRQLRPRLFNAAG